MKLLTHRFFLLSRTLKFSIYPKRFCSYYYSENPDWVRIGSKAAREKFALSPTELTKLQSFDSPNPYNLRDKHLKLYWLPDVQNASLKKWGSLSEVRTQAALRKPPSDSAQTDMIFGMDPKAKKAVSLSDTIRRRIKWFMNRNKDEDDTPPPWTPRSFLQHPDPALKSIKTAFCANIVQFVVKICASMSTGSASMFSEAMHSLSDTINQGFQFYGVFRSAKEADAQHPYGYGKERNIFAMFQAMSVLFIGGGFSMYHGFSSLLSVLEGTYQTIQYPGAALLIVGFVFIVETYSCSVAYIQVGKQAKRAGMELWEYIRIGPDPMNAAILMEDGGGMLCSVIAGAALSLYIVTANPIFDAVGSMLIGSTLACSGLFMIQKNRDALIERSLPPKRISEICKMLQGDPIVAADGVHDVKCTMLGGNSVRFKAEILFNAEAIARRRFHNPLEKWPLFTPGKSFPTPEAAEDFWMREHANQLVAFSAERLRLETLIRKLLPDFESVHIDLESL
uniref:Proton-coupled zinc antiporter SLC30A9, mitochondrial n=1 Tax=Hirondellea gigas TaxID=1518452 RepID=A0A6A7GBT4_9CRUS